MAIERDMLANPTSAERTQILPRLDDIERSINEMKTPLSFADQVYVLRDHVAMVRRRMLEGAVPAAAVSAGASPPVA